MPRGNPIEPVSGLGVTRPAIEDELHAVNVLRMAAQPVVEFAEVLRPRDELPVHFDLWAVALEGQQHALQEGYTGERGLPRDERLRNQYEAELHVGLRSAHAH